MHVDTENLEYYQKKIAYYKTIIPAAKYDMPGVYCVIVDGEIVYIGKARNMVDRLAQHIYHIEDGGNKTPGEKAKYGELRRAKDYGYSVTFDTLYQYNEQDGDIDDAIGKTEAKYINQYMPKLNKQIPNLDNYKRYKNKDYEMLDITDKRNLF